MTADEPMPSRNPPLRLFIDPARDGATNMAIDGALLQEVGRATSLLAQPYRIDPSAAGQGVLRLYRWSPATLSLGYFQKYDDPQRLGDPVLSALPVVRRCTGGGAIVHADELTYSLVLQLDHPLAGHRTRDLYDWMHARIAEAIAALGAAGVSSPGATAVRSRALCAQDQTEVSQDSAGPSLRPEGPSARLRTAVAPGTEGSGEQAKVALRGGPQCAAGRGGPFLCFACHASFDLMAGADKLAGSAQRRTRTGLLQHGSVVLSRSHPIQPSSAVGDLLHRPVRFEEMAAALAAAVRSAGVELIDSGQAPAAGSAFAEQHRLHSGVAWVRRL